VSISVYVGVGLYLGTFRYLAFAVVFAPLMLFRTERSIDWGLTIYAKFLDRLNESNLSETATFLVWVFSTPIVGTGIRIAATVYWAMRNPLQTIKDAPQNWLRQALCTDIVHPPEILPLEIVRGKGKSDNITTFQFLPEVMKEYPETWQRAIVVALFLPVILLGWLPSIFYRVSFKATALAYAPFIWVAQSTLRNPLSLKTRLERIKEGEMEKVRRGLSYIILATMTAKLALVFGMVDRAYIESKFPSQKVVSTIVLLDRWPWWQITLTADAVLTFLLLFFSDAALARLETQQKWSDELVLSSVTTGTFIRALLSIATICYFFYLALLVLTHAQS
ncbi:MAG: hypothetical protein WAM70_06910, partial [Pyrinomonadaceae bacterium]